VAEVPVLLRHRQNNNILAELTNIVKRKGAAQWGRPFDSI